MARRAAGGIALALLFLTATALGPGVLAGDSGGNAVPLATPEGFDNTVFEIRVYENGSARWTLKHVRLLDNQTQVENFRDFAARFERTETDFVRSFHLRAQRLTAFGTNVTGREMNATNFDRRAYVNQLGQTRGVVQLSFLWTNFARTRGDVVIVGDVFEGGMYLAANQRLVFSHGPDLVFRSVQPDPDSMATRGNLTASSSVTWFGERPFADSRPRLELVPPEMVADDQPTPTPTATATATATPSPATDTATSTPVSPKQESDDSGGFPMLAVGIVLLLALGGGAAWHAGAFSRDSNDAAGGVSRQDSPASPVDASDSQTPTEAQAEPTVSDTDLLSDEGRVRKLLDENGGRMKQVEIVEETEWSKSKVSMLLSEMEEEGEISKLRVGRENIISLVGEEPDAAGSPFEDDE